MEKIQLNFLELIGQNKSFKIYRKLSSEKDEALYFGKLPIHEDGSGIYQNYQISLIPEEGFEEFNYLLSYNHFISCRLIFDKLEESLKKANELNFEVKERFLRTIEIPIETVSIGKRVITLSSYFLNEKQKFGFLIDYKFSKNLNVNDPREELRFSLSLDQNYRSNKNFYKHKYNYIVPFLDKIPSFPINGVDYSISNTLLKIESNLLKKKIYIFNNKNTGTSQFQGIKNYGPYQFLKNEKDIKFYFIFEDKYKNLANNIYLALLGRLSPGTFPGLKKMFNINLSKESVRRINLKAPTVENAKIIIDQIKAEISNDVDYQPFVIYIEDNNYDEIQKSIYYLMKLEFLKAKIPSQVISNEKIGSRETLKWSVSSIGLQIFAKSGGIPWIVQPSETNCLILGIGQAYEIDNLNGVKKQFAYSVCVDSSGLYKKLEILSNEKQDQDFYLAIKSNIIKLLKDDDFRNYKKCAIHVPFKISLKIIDSIKEAALEINDIEVKVIKVNTKNKFFGYGHHNTKVPYESSYIKLGYGEYLVWFEGLNFGKEIVYKKTGNPIHIEFLNNNASTVENELSYLQDILNLSGANWRGFNAKAKPISIYYSELIAEYSIELQKMEGFTSSIFIQNEPWFL